MDPKDRPNRRIYIETLRRMTADEKVRKAFELGELARRALLERLCRRFPERTEAQIREIALARRIAKFRDRSY